MRLLVGIYLFCFLLPCVSVADDKADIKTATLLIKTNKNIDAEKILSSINSYPARFLAAVSQFKQDKYLPARLNFLRAVYLADSDTQRFNALFNAAVSSFFAGNYADAYQLFYDARRYNPQHKTISKMLEVSKYLYQLVLKDKATGKQQPGSKRAGEGKKLVALDEVGFDREAAVRFSDKEEIKTESVDSDFFIKQEEINRLVKKGIEAIRIRKDTTSSILFDELSDNSLLAVTQAQSSTPENSQYMLWKRMFELEQNIPAELEEQIELPGVRPW